MKLVAGTAREDTIDGLIETFKADYDTHGCLESIPCTDVSSTLPRLVAMGLRLFIATNKRLTPTRRILSHLRWESYFSGIYAIDHTAAPAVSDKMSLVRSIMRIEELEVPITAMVGDSLEDARAADESRIVFFAALWGYGGTALTASPHQGLRRFSELLERLQQ